MINFKEEVEKRKEQLIQDIETLCAIPSVYNEKTIGENQPYGSECRQALDAMLAIGKRDGFVVHDENGYAGHIDIGDQEERNSLFKILKHYVQFLPFIMKKQSVKTNLMEVNVDKLLMLC